jgi:hypothetical protein
MARTGRNRGDGSESSAFSNSPAIRTTRIRAATIEEVVRDSGDWVFVDLGFAGKSRKTCGLLIGDGEPRNRTFSELQSEIVEICRTSAGPLNLLIEAPLSVAFGANGDPAGRAIELRDGVQRYWYVGLGCSVLVAATYLLRSIYDLPRTWFDDKHRIEVLAFERKRFPSSYMAYCTIPLTVRSTH